MSPLRRSFRARQAEWRMAVCLIPLFSLGCAYYGAYGGPEPNPEVNAALAHELEVRDVKLALDFDCSAWRGERGAAPPDFADCINAVAIIRSTMQALDILWYPDPEVSAALKPRYTVHLVLKEKLSLSWTLMNLVSIATLFSVVPHNQMVTREIGAVVSEPGRVQQNPAALERARREFGQIDLTRWLLAGDAVSVDQSIVASTTSTHRVRYWTSLFLPTAWMGGRGHRRVIVFGPIFYQPKAREPFEVVSREILLELIRQLPSSAADENTTSDSSAEDVQNSP